MVRLTELLFAKIDTTGERKKNIPLIVSLKKKINFDVERETLVRTFAQFCKVSYARCWECKKEEQS